MGRRFFSKPYFILLTCAGLLLAGAYVLKLYLRHAMISSCEQVVQSIRDQRITPAPDGIALLPVDSKCKVAKGIVYVDHTPDGRLKVLFPTWFGRGNDLDGYLYVQDGVQPADTSIVDWASGKEVCVDVGPIRMMTFKPIKPQWYAVTRRLE